MIQRHLSRLLSDAMTDSPVILINGARQTGKSTLAESHLQDTAQTHYFTMDDATVLRAAKSDPAGFVTGLNTPVVLDEIQRTPELFMALKYRVDRQRKPGQFLLTGSANVLLLPKLSESLAGRMEILTLWPFSQGELEGIREDFPAAVFSARPHFVTGPRVPLAGVLERAMLGGYPEIHSRKNTARRNAWFGGYLTTILQRDIRDLANIDGLSELPRLLALLAARSAGLQNFTELSRSSGLPQTTLKRYMTLLETTFLVVHLAPWFANISKRLVKAPKLYLTDTGFLAHLLALDPKHLPLDPRALGGLLENFVVVEILKQLSWSHLRARAYHYRTHTGQEVDLVLEDSQSRIVGIEIKTTSSLNSEDTKGLRSLAEDAGKKFVRGIVLYGGPEIVPLGSNLTAVPFSALWRTLG